MIYYIDEFLYDVRGSAGYKSEKTERPVVESKSAGFDFFNLGQELIKVLRHAIDHQAKTMNGEIKKVNTLEELTEFTKKAFEKNKAAKKEKK